VLERARPHRATRIHRPLEHRLCLRPLALKFFPRRRHLGRVPRLGAAALRSSLEEGELVPMEQVGEARPRGGLGPVGHEQRLAQLDHKGRLRRQRLARVARPWEGLQLGQRRRERRRGDALVRPLAHTLGRATRGQRRTHGLFEVLKKLTELLLRRPHLLQLEQRRGLQQQRAGARAWRLQQRVEPLPRVCLVAAAIEHLLAHARDEARLCEQCRPRLGLRGEVGERRRGGEQLGGAQLATVPAAVRHAHRAPRTHRLLEPPDVHRVHVAELSLGRLHLLAAEDLHVGHPSQQRREPRPVVFPDHGAQLQRRLGQSHQAHPRLGDEREGCCRREGLLERSRLDGAVRPLAAAFVLGAAVLEVEAQLLLECQAAPQPLDLLLREIDRALQLGGEPEPIGHLHRRLHPLTVVLLDAFLEATQALGRGEGLHRPTQRGEQPLGDGDLGRDLGVGRLEVLCLQQRTERLVAARLLHEVGMQRQQRGHVGHVQRELDALSQHKGNPRRPRRLHCRLEADQVLLHHRRRQLLPGRK